MVRRSRTVVLLTVAAVGSVYLLAAFNALAQGSAFHSGMSSHRSTGSFSGMHAHQPFSPVRPPLNMMPPPPPPGTVTPPGATTTGAAPSDTGTARTGMTGTDMHHHHHHHFDDDDFFFFDTVFPFPDPFFVDVVQPVYVSPNNEYWYWCPSSRAYYPWVRTCDAPWQPVPATPPPPPPAY